MQNTVLISVVVPVYNSELYLKQCIDSILRQSFTEFEFICVNDCSTDNSLKILREYSQRDKRLRILENKKNIGLALTRNRGMEESQGKYIYFLDSDDWIIPDALQIMWDYAERHGTDVILFNSGVKAEGIGLGGTTVDWNMGDLYGIVMSGEDAFCNIMEKGMWSSAVWRQFWKKDFLTENNIMFENKRMAEDCIFTTIALLSANRVVFVDQQLHFYRRHNDSLSFVHSTDMMRDYALNYMTMLRFWIKNSFSQRTNMAIMTHMDNIAQKIRYMHVSYEDVYSNEMFESIVDRHLYRLIVNSNQGSFLERSLDKEFVDKLNGYEDIYIYGSAEYAIEMYEQLIKWNMCIKGFVVTKYSKARQIHNRPVYTLDELCTDKEKTIFVLGVTEKNRKDVVENLIDHGYMYYLSLQDM